MTDPVLLEVRRNVAYLTLNRPEKLNAFSYEMNDRLLQLLDRIEDDPEVRAVTRGINLTMGEGLRVESEQFARVAPSYDTGEALDAWIARRQPVYRGD